MPTIGVPVRRRQRRPSRSGRALSDRLDTAFLPFFGPAQVSPIHAVGEVSDHAREREKRIRTVYERVVGPDGHAYVVERDVTD
ncbi:hypothetical protein GCM10025864_23330 [Luteimicrobium album]|uniref:Uncharacterized protein n=1 Tax=Luteimicrobium album TaxID=1054550 RepID=A0ABQ6I435_9MICO|nr:hypothetical protein [Luteimicrobium album]GMA24574.1 hypothetical protein GCM10025864_23330 [Luteimicrobium album]